VSEEEIDEDDEPLGHDFIFKYDRDPYIEIKESKVGDIVTAGVLSAFYGDRR